MRLALVCFYCLCVFVYVLYFIATMSFAGYFLPVLFCMLSMLISDSRFDLVWFRLSCDHGWIRSGSVNVRKQQQQQQCTRKRMHTTLLGRMPGPRRPIHVRLCIKKNQNAPILSEHPPVRRKIVKTFRWDQRLQIQKEKLERAYTFPSPRGKNVKTFRWERRLLLCYCKRRSASESEGITLGGAREVQKYSLSVWPFKARSLII